MRVLLDTNAFLRWTGDRGLPRSVERIVERQTTEIFFSIVSAWEILIKFQLKLTLGDVEHGMNDIGAMLLPLEFPHLEELSRLPFHPNHRDPFDRMLIAQAIAEDIPIISSDSRFEEYKKVRVIWD